MDLSTGLTPAWHFPPVFFRSGSEVSSPCGERAHQKPETMLDSAKPPILFPAISLTREPMRAPPTRRRQTTAGTVTTIDRSGPQSSSSKETRARWIRGEALTTRIAHQLHPVPQFVDARLDRTDVRPAEVPPISYNLRVLTPDTHIAEVEATRRQSPCDNDT
jgi:hypothetical protein